MKHTYNSSVIVLVRVGDEARAYPIQILMWHEIVNDSLGGIPLLVTFCPPSTTSGSSGQPSALKHVFISQPVYR